VSLLKRIVDIWTTPADEEIYRVLDEWAIDYGYDEEFLHVLKVIESHIVDEEYQEAIDLFADYAPITMPQAEIDDFLWLVKDAQNYV